MFAVLQAPWYYIEISVSFSVALAEMDQNSTHLAWGVLRGHLFRLEGVERNDFSGNWMSIQPVILGIVSIQDD